MQIKKCEVFFTTLSGIAAFFSKWTKRTQALDTIMKRQKVAILRWNYNGRLVLTMSEYRDSLIELFETVLENSANWDTETINSSRGFLDKMGNRFKNFDDLDFLELCNFITFKESYFPEKQLKSLIRHYGQYFDMILSRWKLTALYETQEIERKNNASKLLTFLKKMVGVVCVISPATNASVECSFSTLKWLKIYLRNSTGQDRASSVFLLAIEINRVRKISQHPRTSIDCAEIMIPIEKARVYVKIKKLLCSRDLSLDLRTRMLKFYVFPVVRNNENQDETPQSEVIFIFIT
ncbi:hypothetical protein HUJ04_011302 [Dendroctonus ponderosae]|nr:hypothetical protein HUJ04_011302 [Dendroctonus ponderosae]